MLLGIVLYILSLFYLNYAAVVINKYEENNEISECELDPKLVEEIQSYKNVTKYIMDHVINESGDEMYELYTKFIDNFGARLAGSEVLEKAIDHMINLANDKGISNVTTEQVEVPHWVRGHESIEMISPRSKNIQLLGLGTSVSTPPEGITAEAIVVESFDELNSLNNKNVKGKIVVYNPPYISYGDTVVYRSQGATKAAKKGAVASLTRSITPFSLYTPHTGAQYYDDNVTKIPTAAITVEDAELLHRLYKSKQKIVIKLKMSSTSDTKTSRNTLIDLKGKDNPEKLVIVSGHIDSWDVGEGAMDDGGGMWISWFAPVVLNSLKLQPRRTVRAILWTSEEPGLVGAFQYLKVHKNELANINFIMESDEGTFKPLGLDVAGSNQAKCIIAEILKLFTPIDKLTESGYPGSDITIFIQNGVPGASLLNKNERYYWYHHSEADTMSIQNKNDVVLCAAFWAAVSYVIADISVDIPR